MQSPFYYLTTKKPVFNQIAIIYLINNLQIASIPYHFPDHSIKLKNKNINAVIINSSVVLQI